MEAPKREDVAPMKRKSRKKADGEEEGLAAPGDGASRPGLAVLRAEIAELYERRRKGEIRDRDFQKAQAEKTIALYRRLVLERLAPGEPLLEEHHVISAHMRLNQSVLRETDQEGTSLFLTDRRLVRVRAIQIEGRPVTADEKDGTTVDEVRLEEIQRLRVRRQVRVGEVAVGLTICAMALLFHSLLLVTGTLLIGLGAAGVLHGLLLPTRWIEVEERDGQRIFPICIRVLRKSGRRLVGRLRALLHDAHAIAGPAS